VYASLLVHLNRYYSDHHVFLPTIPPWDSEVKRCVPPNSVTEGSSRHDFRVRTL
jgi:hypothetical protein